MKRLALVTAKSTSSRVPYKNKQVLHGKPLYKWTTDFVNGCAEFFHAAAFSSDNPKSFNVDKGWLALKRPRVLVEDKTPHILSVQHALQFAEELCSCEFDRVFLFQPTNPFRTKKVVYHADVLLDQTKTGVRKVDSMYIDNNLDRKYIREAKWGDDSPPVLIGSGILYAYTRKYLTDGIEGDAERMTMVVPKVMGYNINDQLDFAVVETFMSTHGVPYGTKDVFV